MWDILSNYFQIVLKPTITPLIIFIDDTLRNFTASNKILGLLCRSSDKTPDATPKLSRYASRYWKKLNINETYDEISGIPTKSFEILTSIIQSNIKNVEIIILDWDKTLTVHASYKSDVINRYVMECYFGGYERMRAIKKFFAKLKKMKCKVLILTSNGRAKRDIESFQKGLSYVGASWVKIMHTDVVSKTVLINKMNLEKI